MTRSSVLRIELLLLPASLAASFAAGGIFAGRPQLVLICVAGVLAASLLFVRGEVFVAAFVLVVAASQVGESHPLRNGPVSIYVTDLLLALTVLRAFVSRERRPAARVFGYPTRLSLWSWAAAMLIAALTGWRAGATLDETLRLAMPLVYVATLYLAL